MRDPFLALLALPAGPIPPRTIRSGERSEARRIAESAPTLRCAMRRRCGRHCTPWMRERITFPALAAYERGMVDYGFRAVRASMRNMERFHAQGRLTRAFTKLFFRAIDAVPPLKAAFLSQ